MPTNILETLGTVLPDGTLELDQKVTVVPGRVKVRLESIAFSSTGWIKSVLFTFEPKAACWHFFAREIASQSVI